MRCDVMYVLYCGHNEPPLPAPHSWDERVRMSCRHPPYEICRCPIGKSPNSMQVLWQKKHGNTMKHYETLWNTMTYRHVLMEDGTKHEHLPKHPLDPSPFAGKSAEIPAMVFQEHTCAKSRHTQFQPPSFNKPSTTGLHMVSSSQALMSPSAIWKNSASSSFLTGNW